MQELFGLYLEQKGTALTGSRTTSVSALTVAPQGLLNLLSTLQPLSVPTIVSLNILNTAESTL